MVATCHYNFNVSEGNITHGDNIQLNDQTAKSSQI